MESVNGSRQSPTVKPVEPVTITSPANPGTGLGGEIVTVLPARSGGADRIEFNKTAKVRDVKVVPLSRVRQDRIEPTSVRNFPRCHNDSYYPGFAGQTSIGNPYPIRYEPLPGSAVYGVNDPPGFEFPPPEHPVEPPLSRLASQPASRAFAPFRLTLSATGPVSGSFEVHQYSGGQMTGYRRESIAVCPPNPIDLQYSGLGNELRKSTVVTSTDVLRPAVTPYEIHLPAWLDAVNTGESAADNFFRGFVKDRMPTVQESATNAIFQQFAILIPIAPEGKRKALLFSIVRQDHSVEAMKRVWSKIGIDQFPKDEQASVLDRLRALGIVTSDADARVATGKPNGESSTRQVVFETSVEHLGEDDFTQEEDEF